MTHKPASIFGAGGPVEGRLYLWREGARHTRLTVPAAVPMEVSCDATAQVKMKLSCHFYHSGELDFYRDLLAPCLYIGGQEYPLGLYAVARCHKTFDGGTTLWQATGLDLCHKAARHVPEQMLYWAQGTSYRLAVEQLLQASGLVDYRVADSPLVLATHREDWPRGENALAAANALLSEMNYHSLFCNLQGQAQGIPFRGLGQSPPTVQYTRQGMGDILLPGHRLSLDGLLQPNVFYYTCEHPELAAPLSVRVENTSPASPHSIPNQGRVPVFRQVDNAPNREALLAMAQRELENSLRTAGEITFYTGLCPLHSAFEVVQLEKENFFGTVHETFWRMSLAPGQMMEHRGRVVQTY